MILLRLMGGLGNQMFQYAYAVSLAKKTIPTSRLTPRY
jgi:hypothetical protein